IGLIESEMRNRTVVSLRYRRFKLVPQAEIEREPRADLEVVLEEQPEEAVLFGESGSAVQLPRRHSQEKRRILSSYGRSGGIVERAARIGARERQLRRNTQRVPALVFAVDTEIGAEPKAVIAGQIGERAGYVM